MAKHNIMVQATPLNNVVGRVDYISSHDRQEHLVATYSSNNDPEFWKELQAHCNRQAKEAGHDRGCGGREFMTALANELSQMDPNELTKKISDSIKELTGTDNTVALHWNKKHTNFHCHIIVSENKEINEISYGAVLTKNTYYDANGKRSNKKNCIDPSTKELLPGCQLLKKGDRKATVNRFGTKNPELSSKSFLMEVKQELAELQNDLLRENRFTRKQSTLYISEQHIGKNKTTEQVEAIKERNQSAREWNNTVDKVLDTGDELLLEDLYDSRQMIRKESQYGIKEWVSKLNEEIHYIKERITDWLEDTLGIDLRKPEEQERPSLDFLIDKARDDDRYLDDMDLDDYEDFDDMDFDDYENSRKRSRGWDMER